MKSLRRVILLCFLMFAAFAPSHAAGQFFFFENPMVGKQAPEFTLNTVKGKNVSFSKFRGKDAAIVFFWATWCPHCRTQIKHLNTQKAAMTKKGIKVALVDLEESADQVQSYLQKQKITFDVFLDKDASVAEEYGIVGVPTFFFIDKSGVVRAVEHDIPENYEELLLGK